MTRGSRILLEDILESIEKIESYLEGVTMDDFLEDEEKQDALLRRLLVIGEAVKALPSSVRQAHPEVPWREIAGARDIVVHEYFRIDLDLTWDMLQNDIPDLKAQVTEILRSDSST